jgi:polysaccharide export outer membrane protein
MAGLAWAADEAPKVAENVVPAETNVQQSEPNLTLAQSLPTPRFGDPLRYTLGPDDVIEIIVMRHPEFSGTYPINLEGKIQYKFVGDIDVNGLTKKELENKIKEVIAGFVINPEVNVTVLAYKSKVIYVVGEVRAPGKYYMRSDSITVREAVVGAGLPTLSAAMRRCRLITPDASGKAKIQNINLYEILYGGNLKQNVEMLAGDVLYVPATVMAKIMNVINPVAQPVATAAGGVRSAATMTP